MRRALVVVHGNTCFTGLIDLGRMLKHSGRYEPVFLFFFAQAYPTVARDIATCHAEEIPCLDQNGEPITSLPGISPAVDNRPTSRGRIRQRVKRLLSYLPEPLAQWSKRLIIRLLREAQSSILHQLRYLRTRIQFARQLIRQQKPSLLVLCGDLVGYDTAAFIKAAHQEHIPAVIVSGWITGPFEHAEVYLRDPAFSMQKWSNRLAGTLYPRWVYEHKGRKLVRLPASRLLAREWLGLAPPLPWVLHSGYADAIAVESEAIRLHGISEGLPPDKLVMTGSIANDVMVRNLQEVAKLRADLYQRLNLPPGRPMILSALAPEFIPVMRERPECDFQIYDELVQFWVQSLAAIWGYNVVISLHPSVKYEDMKYIEQWGVRIAKEKTVALIPLCDIYVASMSFTIHWAIACGKPVVNYDVYRFQYTDWIGGAEGVITVEEKDEFLSVLRRLTEDHEFYIEIAARQAASASQRWQMDGQAGQRILQLFDQLVGQYEGGCLR